jgi:PKD repeat protein
MKFNYVLISVFTLFSFFAKAQCPVASNCTPATATNAGQGFAMGIYNVTFGSINKSSGGDTDGYQNYSCTDGTSVLAGNSYAISITTGTNVEENVRIWIDYDNNGVFNTTSELVFTSNNKFVHTGNITISNGAVSGTPLRMRIAADYSGSAIPTPCSTPQYSQTEDYKVTVSVNTNAPAAEFTVNDTLSCSGSFTFTDLSQNVPTSWKWYFGDGNVSILQNPSHTYLNPGKYTVKLVATNSAGSDSITKTNYVRYSTTAPVAASCSPITSTYCCGYGIFRVKLNTIDNTTGDASEGYKDFTCSKITQLYEGNFYNLLINTSTGNNQDTRVWIDYNNNGVFGNDELVFTSLNSKNPTTNLTIPGGQTLNTPLRMRVASDFAGSSFGPCSNLTHGQVEDYTVIILENTQAPVANFVAANVSACDSIVQFNNTSQNTITSYLWYFGDGDSSTVQNPSHEYQTVGTYTVTLIVTGPFGSDTIIKPDYVTYSGGPKAATCTPNTTSHCCGMGITKFVFNTINHTSSNGSAGYQNFTCTQSTTVNVGQTYNVQITNGNQFAENVRVWIDYNNNGSFETNELVFSNNAQQVHNGTITISSNATPNTALRMRVGSDWLQNAAPEPCVNVTYGQFEDYTVTVLSNQPPTANFIASDTSTCTRTISFTDISGGGPTSWMWYFGDGDSSSVQNPTHTYQNSGGFTVSLYVSNANGSNTLVKTNYINISGNAGPAAAFCEPQTTNTCCGIGITNVQFSSINNTTAPGTDGYKDYTCNQQTNVNVGNSYTLTVTTGTQYMENVRAWIDFNNNTTFETNEVVMNSQQIMTTHTATVVIPATAVLNTPLRMRVISDFNNLTGSCTNVQYGQAEDYTIIVVPNNVAPVTNFTASSTQNCNGFVAFTDLTQNIPTSWKWYFGDGDSSSVQNPTHTYLSSGLFTVTLKTTNAYGNNTLVKTNYINITSLTGPKPASCTPVTTANCCGIGIYNVTLGSINNTTADGSEGYKDYSCSQSSDLFTGNSYSISIKTGNQYNENVKVWIDYNNSGVFDNNELVYTSSAVENHTGSITIPSTAILNTGLRMRVGSDFNALNDPCANVQYGQFEDYTVKILTNVNPPSSNFSATSTTSCNGIISFTDISQNAPTSWKWYFGDGDSSSVQNPTHIYTSIGQYTVTLVTTNQYGSDTEVKVNYINITSVLAPVSASCAPITTGTCCGIGIYNVTFDSINRTSSPGTDSYKDYTCTDMTTVDKGSNVAISITTGNQYVENVYVWLDYNNNSTFETNEKVFESLNTLQFHNGTVAISATLSQVLIKV